MKPTTTSCMLLCSLLISQLSTILVPFLFELFRRSSVFRARGERGTESRPPQLLSFITSRSMCGFISTSLSTAWVEVTGKSCPEVICSSFIINFNTHI